MNWLRDRGRSACFAEAIQQTRYSHVLPQTARQRRMKQMMDPWAARRICSAHGSRRYCNGIARRVTEPPISCSPTPCLARRLPQPCSRNAPRSDGVSLSSRRSRTRATRSAHSCRRWLGNDCAVRQHEPRVTVPRRLCCALSAGFLVPGFESVRSEQTIGAGCKRAGSAYCSFFAVWERAKDSVSNGSKTHASPISAPSTQQPDLSPNMCEDRKQESGANAEQQHAVGRLERAHHYPVVLQGHP